jgi:hypothetical protein
MTVWGTTREFHGEKRTNDTHESKTDPDASSVKEIDGPGSEAEVFGARDN